MKGSDWKKWDLHIHTAASFNYGSKNMLAMTSDEKHEYIKELLKKINGSDISVFGIMDYWTFDGYKSILDFSDKTIQIEKTILPGIELRLEAPTSHRLNYHVLFSNKISIDKLNEFHSKLKMRNNERAPSRAGLIDLAKTFDLGKRKTHGYTEDDIDDDEKMYQLGCKTAEITRDSLIDALKIFKKSDFLKIVPYDTYGGLEPLNWKEQSQADQWFFQYSDAFEDRKESNVKLFSGIKTDDNKDFINDFIQNLGGYPKPVYSGSDAHKISNIGKFPNEKATWIKAEATFAGLRQTLFEPEHRVAISKDKPISPVKKIESVNINLPDEIKLKMKDKDPETFCFAGTKEKLCFSDYFNCIIGGRGTGKSTLLNLIYKAFDSDNKVSFFVDNNLFDSSMNRLNVTDSIFIEGSADELEYLEQNKIEQFATDPIKFTNAIYNRLRKKDAKLSEYQQSLDLEIEKIDTKIEKIEDYIELLSDRRNKKREYRAARKISATVKSKEYEELSNSISSSNNSYVKIKRDRERVQGLIENVDEFLDNNRRLRIPVDPPPTKYITNYNAFISDIIKSKEKYLSKSEFINEVGIEDELEKSIRKGQEALEDYLKSRGIGDENLDDLKNASTEIDLFKEELEEFNEKIHEIEEKINGFGNETIVNANEIFNTQLELGIKEFQTILDDVNARNPENIDKIHFSPTFDDARAKDDLFNEFYEKFESYSEEYNLQLPSVKKCLFSIDPFDLYTQNISYENFTTSLQGDKQYHKFLTDIFENENNYSLYKLLVEKIRFNSSKYLHIEVKYKDKILEKCSFGQKCTAVILILLLFGNNPILIDEPEAHLDSSLIANYLVDLIKRKKSFRQIVFATHNANFVINGDAEQIFIMEMADTITSIKTSTIENTKKRSHLLKLEGGKEAFFHRENKYEIK